MSFDKMSMEDSECKEEILMHLKELCTNGDITSMKRGVYCFNSIKEEVV